MNQRIAPGDYASQENAQNATPGAHASTVRLTAAQALVRYLAAQRVASEDGSGRTEPLFGGVFAIFGHGNTSIWMMRSSVMSTAQSNVEIAVIDAHFVPARFFGYYFRGSTPVSVSGNWTVTLDLVPPVSQLPEVLDYVTQGKYSIASPSRDQLPEYMLVHDRRDGACWLWKFDDGLRFVESTDPVIEIEDSGTSDAQNPKFLGP